MALFAAAARRAITSYLPLLRPSVSRGGISLLRPLVPAAARPMPFSSATGVKPSSDDELLRVVKSETEVDEQCGKHDPDDKNSASASDESSSSSVRNQEDKGMRYRCVAEMGDDSSVKFSCTIYPSKRKMVIHAVALRPPPPFDEESDEELDFSDFDDDDLTESKEDDLTRYEEDYFTESEEVVEFSKLDVKLQLALYKLVKPMYYDTPRITELLQEPTMSKDQARTLFWETELWGFVNKEAMTAKAASMAHFKINGKGQHRMSMDDHRHVAHSWIKYAVECHYCNRAEKKITGEDIYRYLKLRGETSFSPKYLQETILDRLEV